MAVSGRRLVPAEWQESARALYVGLGRVTARLRLTPGFVMVGASRAGTTSLFRALSAHPQVLRPTVNKGVRYFDLNYFRSFAWYQGHFPVVATARRRTADHGEPMAFEASGYYMFHPLAIERLARALPQVRIVAMLRDPVERAYSGWKHESARGFEWESFETALELEDERLEGEVARIAADRRYESFCHRHHSHRHRGEYASQVERIFSAFPSEQVYVLESENFYREPEREYARLLAFLGLRNVRPRSFGRHNARPSAAMPEHLSRHLTAHYKGHDEHLAELLGRRTSWMR